VTAADILATRLSTGQRDTVVVDIIIIIIIIKKIIRLLEVVKRNQHRNGTIDVNGTVTN